MNTSDMDDLFKRAADNYPLRTDSSDWEKVARALDKDDNDSALVSPAYSNKGKRNRRRYLLLLLLLPLAAVSYFGIKTPNPAASGEKLVSAPGANPGQTVADTKHAMLLSPQNSNKLDNSKSDIKTRQESASGNINEPDPGNSVQGVAGGYRALNTGVHLTAHSAARSSHLKDYDDRSANNTSSLNNAGSDYVVTISDPLTEKTLSLASLPDPASFNYLDLNRRSAFVTGVQGGKNNLISSEPKQSSVKKDLRRHPVYAGIIVAPDISTVKFQSVKGVGITAGALLGYRLSPKLALETGFYIDMKKYYSKGEYFNKKNMNSWLNNVDLLDVNGSCSMFEVPVNLRYNIHTGKKNTWFATTGLSSYFIFKEAYNYSYLYNGAAGDHTYTYKKPSQNWFSIVNFSAGYEHALGRVGNLRVEPYLRIPLSGMGTGSLPIISSGLNVGITRTIK